MLTHGVVRKWKNDDIVEWMEREVRLPEYRLNIRKQRLDGRVWYGMVWYGSISAE